MSLLLRKRSFGADLELISNASTTDLDNQNFPAPIKPCIPFSRTQLSDVFAIHTLRAMSSIILLEYYSKIVSSGFVFPIRVRTLRLYGVQEKI